MNISVIYVIFICQLLSSKCFIRILKWGEDRRFDEMRSNLWKLAIFWLLQVSYHFFLLQNSQSQQIQSDACL